jgi:DNA-directed RNA polymerase specialized sigma24 family protein
VPTAAGSTLTFLLTEAAAVAAIAVWSRRPGWSQLHVLALAQALRTLPVRQRQAIVLHYLVDLPVEEVARILAARGGTVKSLLAH